MSTTVPNYVLELQDRISAHLCALHAVALFNFARVRTQRTKWLRPLLSHHLVNTVTLSSSVSLEVHAHFLGYFKFLFFLILSSSFKRIACSLLLFKVLTSLEEVLLLC